MKIKYIHFIILLLILIWVVEMYVRMDAVYSQWWRQQRQCWCWWCVVKRKKKPELNKIIFSALMAIHEWKIRKFCFIFRFFVFFSFIIFYRIRWYDIKPFFFHFYIKKKKENGTMTDILNGRIHIILHLLSISSFFCEYLFIMLSIYLFVPFFSFLSCNLVVFDCQKWVLVLLYFNNLYCVFKMVCRIVYVVGALKYFI